MRPAIIVMLGLLTGLAGSRAVAQEPAHTVTPPLRACPPAQNILILSDVERLALENNPLVARAVAQLEAARGQWLQSGLYPNPTVGYQGMEINNEGTAGQQGFFISQRVVTAGKLKLNREVAGWEVERLANLLDAQQRRVLNDVRVWFYNVLIAQRRVELAGTLLQISKTAADASKQLHDAGLAGLQDVLQAQIEADTADIVLGKAVNQREEAWRRLMTIVGLPQMPVQLLVGTLEKDRPAYTWESSVAQLLDSSPEVAMALAKVEKARWKAKRAAVEICPDLEVMAGMRHNNTNGYDLGMVQIGFAVPLFNRNQGNLQTARAEIAAATSEVRQVELGLQNRLAVFVRRYNDARLQADTYAKRILPKARQSLDLVIKGYKEKQVNYLTVLVTQQTYFRANLAYLDALQELNESAVLIQGQLLGDSLSAPGQ